MIGENRTTFISQLSADVQVKYLVQSHSCSVFYIDTFSSPCTIKGCKLINPWGFTNPCVCCVNVKKHKEGNKEKDGKRVTGLGWLLSTLPGRQPSVHASLALRRHHIATMHAFMGCNMHCATLFGRSSGKYLYVRHCMTTAFRPFNLPTRGQLWNRLDHSPARSAA